MARIVVAGIAIATITAPTMVNSVSAPDSPSVYLVDDGSGSTSSPPPYNPTPSDGENGNSNGGTDGNNGEGDPNKPNSGDEKSQTPDDEAGEDDGIPVAAQAGLSLGVIGLAVLALIPGRRPPAWMRR